MSLVGFPLLLIPFAIYNIIAFLMPGVGFTGAVTSVAVASFIWGGLFLLVSGCFGFCFLVAVGPRGGPPAAGILGGQESILGIRFLGFFSWSVGVLFDVVRIL